MNTAQPICLGTTYPPYNERCKRKTIEMNKHCLPILHSGLNVSVTVIKGLTTINCKELNGQHSTRQAWFILNILQSKRCQTKNRRK